MKQVMKDLFLKLMFNVPKIYIIFTMIYGLVFKKVHGVNQLNQKAWLEPQIDIDKELRKKRKMTMRKTFSSQ